MDNCTGFWNILFPFKLLLWIVVIFDELKAETTVEVTGPVNPVKTGGILSVHCRVFNMEDGYEVTISRQLRGQTKNRRISWNHDVLSSVEERVFLAVRQLDDASFVYFLSIIDVTKRDEGVYSCKVISTEDTIREVDVDSVNIAISFFPDEIYPLCDQPQEMTFYQGSEVTFNCSSNAGNPLVSLTWIRTGSGSIPEANQVTHDGLTYSVLKLRPTVKDTESMYICQISSEAFPEIVKSCHVGPIFVLQRASDKNQNGGGGGGVTPPPFTVPNIRSPKPKSPIKQDTPRLGESLSSRCDEMCSVLNSPALYWILATSVASFSAFIFFIIGLTLLVKVCRLTGSQKMRPIYTCATEDIYVDLDGRVDENRVYMTLEKPSKTVVVTPDMIKPEGTYTRTPTVQRIH